MTSDYMGAYNNYTMTYSPSGNIGSISCNGIQYNFNNGYSRKTNGTIKNHQLRSLYDMTHDETAFLQWDADGQLQTVSRPCTGDMRHHWWNESGQLSAMVDNTHCGYYGYDGEGNRAYKLTGYSWTDSYNAGTPNYRMYLSDAVLYVNPYMVVTPRGFTKHYYNGSERIAAQIGHLSELPNSIIDSSAVSLERLANARSYMTSVLNNSVTLPIDTVSKFITVDGSLLSELQWQCVDDDEFTMTTTIHCDSDMLYPVLSKAPALLSQQTSGIYFYHPDHLGSATWVTDVGCDPVEYVHYMPYGELWHDQRTSTYSERFKFTGKERDSETGYDYFGARYYSSALPLWLSVDPLAGEYPNLSPYAYCANNPIRNIDEEGETPKDKVVGWALGIITNIIPYISFSHIRDIYVPDNTMDYNSSLQGADNTALLVGSLLTTSGTMDIATGLTLSESGLVMASTGIGAPEGGTALAIGGTFIEKGLLKASIGSALVANATNNRKQGYDRGNKSCRSSSSKQFANSRRMTDREIAQYFNDNNWHKEKYKKNILNKYRKELKGSTNADFYVDKNTHHICIRGNKSNAWVDTGEILK